MLYYDGTYEDWENLWVGPAAFGADRTIDLTKFKRRLHLADSTVRGLDYKD